MRGKPSDFITAGQKRASIKQPARAPESRSKSLPIQASARPTPQARLRDIKFIYEDDFLLAVEKPAGLATIPADGSRSPSLLDQVSRRLKAKRPGGRAAVVHRLDRDTSGVMVFAADARTKTVLMGNWNELVRRRLYVALVEGRPPNESGLLDSWLLENGPSLVRQVPAGTAKALRARTHYRLLATDGQYSLLELDLETGRRHQIRVQLAAIGCPIAGDSRYGAKTDPRARLCLHASLLELKHPFAEKILIFESPENFGLKPAES